MERVYDNYRSYQVQGDCYKYIHKCRNCGKILFEISEYGYKNNKNSVKIPNYCSECGSKQ